MVKDKGVFGIALPLIFLGVVVLASGEAGISMGHYVDSNPIQGTAANGVGVLVIAVGIYFIFQSRR